MPIKYGVAAALFRTRRFAGIDYSRGRRHGSPAKGKNSAARPGTPLKLHEYRRQTAGRRSSRDRRGGWVSLDCNRAGLEDAVAAAPVDGARRRGGGSVAVGGFVMVGFVKWVRRS